MTAAELGGGKYDPELCEVMASSRAEVVVLIVIGGNRGNGFAMALAEAMRLSNVVPEVPAILRAIADSIEETQGAN